MGKPEEAIFFDYIIKYCCLHTLRRRQWHPTPVLLPGKSHGRRSMEGCSPWGRWGSDTTEWLHFHALEKEMATHSSVLAWRIPGTGQPGGLLSIGSHRVEHDWSDLAAAYSYYLYIIVYLFQEVFILFTCFYFTLIKWKKVKVKLLSRVRLFATPWTVAYQAPPSMGFSRQEYWSGLPFSSPGDLPDPGIAPGSPAL